MTSKTEDNINISQRDKILTIIGVYFILLSLQILVKELPIAIPKIMTLFGGIQQVTIMYTLLMLGGTIAGPVVTSLSSIIGRKRFYLFAIAGLAICELLLYYAINFTMIIAVMAVVGVMGAIVQAVGFIIISDVCGTTERAKYIGLYGSVLAFAVITGPIIGGVIIDNFDWRVLFLAVVPFAVIAFFLILRFMPVIPASKGSKIDYLGTFLMGSGITCIILAANWGGKKISWGSPTMIMLYIGFIVAAWLFILVEKRAATPIVPLALFKNRTFLVIFLINLFFILGSTCVSTYFPMYAQKIRGLSATYSGSLVSLKGVVALFVSAINGLIISRIKEYRWNSLVMMIFFAIVTLSLAYADKTTAIAMIVMTMVAWGLTGGLNNVFQMGIQMTMTKSEIVVGMGLLQMILALGATLANVFVGLVMGRTPTNLAVGIHNVFIMATVFFIISVILIIVLLTLRKTSSRVDSKANTVV